VPLSAFDQLGDRVSRFTGYAKSSIVIHMLRRLIGDEPFFAATRNFVAQYQFRAASWADIRRVYERASGADLGWFFRQWLDGTVMPELGLEGVAVVPAGGRYALRFAVTQKRPALRLAVPVTFYFGSGRSETVVAQLSAERNDFQHFLEERPVRIVLDENYDIFRHVAPAEIPPTVDTLLTRPLLTIAGSVADFGKFENLIGAFEKVALQTWYGRGHEGDRTMEKPAGGSMPRLDEKAVTGERIRILRREDGAGTNSSGSALVILGRDNPLIAKLFGRITLPRGGLVFTILNHPQSPGGVVAIFAAASKAEVDAAYSEIIDRPRYSAAVFDKGKLTSRELRQGQRGVVKVIGAARR
jgi:hypothetical protein